MASSDPLPFVQVDRAVSPAVGLLANHLGVTPQHALGSLVEWWRLCSEPRELEAVVRATPPGDEPALWFSEAEVLMRFELCCGKRPAIDALVTLGLVDRGEDGRFRVRGMSRYLVPIARRLRAQEAGAEGGRRSVAARDPSSTLGRPLADPSVDPSATLEGSRKGQSKGQATKRSENRDQRTEIKEQIDRTELDLLGQKIEKPKRNGGRNLELWESMQALRLEADPELEPERVSPAWLNRRIPELVERMRAHWESPNEPDTALADFVWAAYLREPWAREKTPPWPFAPFQSDDVFGRLLLAADRLIDERAADRAAEKAGGGA